MRLLHLIADTQSNYKYIREHSIFVQIPVKHEKEKIRYYDRNGLEIEAEKIIHGERGNLKGELINRERDIQRQWKDDRIINASYIRSF